MCVSDGVSSCCSTVSQLTQHVRSTVMPSIRDTYTFAAHAVPSGGYDEPKDTLLNTRATPGDIISIPSSFARAVKSVGLLCVLRLLSQHFSGDFSGYICGSGSRTVHGSHREPMSCCSSVSI